MAFFFGGGGATGTPGSTGSFVRINHIGNIAIMGDLTVTSLIATTTITTGDNLIVLNDDVTGVPSENSGIEIERGTSDNAQVLWNEITDKWQVGVTGSLEDIITSSSFDHGNLLGLVDDDHTQYLTEARHDSLASDNPHGVSFTQAVASDGGTDITVDEAETLTDGSNADALHSHAIASTAKEVFFAGTDYTGSNNDYRIRNLGATSTNNFTFMIPLDFSTLTSVELIFSANIGAQGSGKDVDLFSDYAGIGEAITTHSESDTSSTYDFGAVVTGLVAIDVSAVYSSLTAGDICGLAWENTAVGATLRHFGIRLRYTT